MSNTLERTSMPLSESEVWIPIAMTIVSAIGGAVWKVWSWGSGKVQSFFDWIVPRANTFVEKQFSLMTTAEQTLKETTGHIARIDEKIGRVQLALDDQAEQLERIESNTKR